MKKKAKVGTKNSELKISERVSANPASRDAFQSREAWNEKVLGLNESSGCERWPAVFKRGRFPRPGEQVDRVWCFVNPGGK